MWTTATSLEHRHQTCPFCGIACDDLNITLRNGRIESIEPRCGKALQGFSAALDSATHDPSANGSPIPIDRAVELGVELLKSSRAPLFAGLVTDVNGMRATLDLADSCGGILDHLNGDALFRNLRVVQDDGWMACTLTEARNRADLIVVIGTSCFDGYPRFSERILLPQESLFPPGGPRRLVLLGPWRGKKPPAGLQDCDPLIIDAPPNQWADIAGLLRGLAAGRPVNARLLGTQLGKQVQALAEQLLEASYSVVTWSAAELDFPHAELTVQRLVDLVRDLNKTTRSSVMPLAGSQGDVTSNQVCSWQTGYPLRTALQRGFPVHDSRLYRYQDLIARGEVDLVIWVSSLDPKVTPPASSLPTIVLGHPGMNMGAAADVFIPVGVPGVDHPGHWYRSDTVCALPLAALVEKRAPSVADVMQAFQSGLAD